MVARQASAPAGLEGNARTGPEKRLQNACRNLYRRGEESGKIYSPTPDGAATSGKNRLTSAAGAMTAHADIEISKRIASRPGGTEKQHRPIRRDARNCFEERCVDRRADVHGHPPRILGRRPSRDPEVPVAQTAGAIGGVSHFGLLGLLIGPLALSYFFELIRMYREEYLELEAASG